MKKKNAIFVGKLRTNTWKRATCHFLSSKWKITLNNRDTENVFALFFYASLHYFTQGKEMFAVIAALLVHICYL